MTTRRRILVSGLAWTFAVGCGGGSDGATCVPGLTIACPCPTGQPGTQTCNPAGTFAACVCATPKVDDGGPGVSGCAGKGPLTFRLVAMSADDVVVQEGTGNAACSPYPPEVAVSIRATARW